jgi:hypothetical protein
LQTQNPEPLNPEPVNGYQKCARRAKAKVRRDVPLYLKVFLSLTVRVIINIGKAISIFEL